MKNVPALAFGVQYLHFGVFYPLLGNAEILGPVFSSALPASKSAVCAEFRQDRSQGQSVEEFPPPLKLRPYGGIEMCILLLLLLLLIADKHR